jgi:hypothetical protein
MLDGNIISAHAHPQQRKSLSTTTSTVDRHNVVTIDETTCSAGKIVLEDEVGDTITTYVAFVYHIFE